PRRLAATSSPVTAASGANTASKSSSRSRPSPASTPRKFQGDMKTPGRDYLAPAFLRLWVRASGRQNSVSSLRTQGPIITGRCCCRKVLVTVPKPGARGVWIPARASLGRDDSGDILAFAGTDEWTTSVLSPQRALGIHVQRINRLAGAPTEPG